MKVQDDQRVERTNSSQPQRRKWLAAKDARAGSPQKLVQMRHAVCCHAESELVELIETSELRPPRLR